jgi:stearoyl-CoA desaturase (delta-9 desaturase)
MADAMVMHSVDPSHCEVQPPHLPVLVLVTTFLGVFVPFLSPLAAGLVLWGWGFHWVDLGLLLGMYALTGLGITVGFHRLFAHRSFRTNGIMQAMLGILGSMAVEGSLLRWVAVHRRHHTHSDRAGDPHSPHVQGTTVLGVLWGLWHAHIGWLFRQDAPGLSHYVKDLQQSRLLRRISDLWLIWAVSGLVIPAVLGGLLTASWQGVLTGLLWGGLVRLFLVHHVTWSINSVCHLWGGRPYPNGDHSCNNFIFGVLALGEGWHNTHHAFPTSARHGLRWWQIDISYYVICGLAVFGLARKIRVPSARAQKRVRRHRA